MRDQRDFEVQRSPHTETDTDNYVEFMNSLVHDRNASHVYLSLSTRQLTTSLRQTDVVAMLTFTKGFNLRRSTLSSLC